MDKSSTRARCSSVQRVMNLPRVRADLPASKPSVVSVRETIRGLAPSLRTLRSKCGTSEGQVDIRLRVGVGSRRLALRGCVGEFAARPRGKLRRAEAALVVYDEGAA
jgi:hypothetical protein